MNETNTERTPQTLIEKLIGCADANADRFREKYGEKYKLPWHLRLMYSAANVIQELIDQLQANEDQLDKALSALRESATCKTCKHGDPKKCPIRSECGKDHALWEFDFE